MHSWNNCLFRVEGETKVETYKKYIKETHDRHGVKAKYYNHRIKSNISEEWMEEYEYSEYVRRNK